MSSLLFTSSFFYKLDPKQWSFRQPYPPLGTLQAAAVARSLNLEVSLFDATLASSPDEIIPSLQKVKPLYVIIYDDGFNYLTKMCLTVMREAAFTMAQLAKESGSTVIVSSSDATDHSEKYFPHGVDYVIQGEGEETLKELLIALEKKESVEKIQGLAFPGPHQTITNPPRAVLRNLDELPLPAWDLVDMEAYRKIWLAHHGYFSLNLATTRGCPYKCNWCAKPIYGNRYNSRSPQKVVDEIEFLLQRYKPDHFWMCDDIFGLKPGWALQFKDEVKKRNLRFRYKIQSRVDLLLEENTIKSLAESGCETVWVGAESGSQKILDAMDKGTTVDQIYRATGRLRQQGIKVAFFIQFGYPGEGKEEVDATLKMIHELVPDNIGISVSYPLPGTKFYENVKNQLSEKQNWKDSEELAMMFDNSFNTAYYQLLHQYIHTLYRQRKGFTNFMKIVRDPWHMGKKEIRSWLVALYLIPRSFRLKQKLQRLQPSE